jgi:hypothetical protein
VQAHELPNTGISVHEIRRRRNYQRNNTGFHVESMHGNLSDASQEMKNGYSWDRTRLCARKEVARVCSNGSCIVFYPCKVSLGMRSGLQGRWTKILTRCRRCSHSVQLRFPWTLLHPIAERTEGFSYASIGIHGACRTRSSAPVPAAPSDFRHTSRDTH